MQKRRQEQVRRAWAVVGLGMAAACAHGGKGTSTGAATPTERRDPNVSTAADMQGQQASARRVEDLFQGRFPGVEAHAAQGGIMISIRGANLHGNGAPLYIVDGQPVTVGTDGLVAINPSDVARIEVVKDPAELAMYGSRSGNGVIRITTKRARR